MHLFVIILVLPIHPATELLGALDISCSPKKYTEVDFRLTAREL